MYLLDTNIISEMRRLPKGKADAGLTTWAKSVNTHVFYTCTVVMMELERGVLGLERKDPIQGQILRIWFENTVKSAFQQRILTIDNETARLCANLHVPDKAAENDAWIAAIAIQHNLILVTRNTADFQDMGIRLLNPFTQNH
ncbi:type II toxin-antitoxin system VapC family toxin [Acinetobacter corruptisaponis]|uniref:Type II toxin-antitoxin system VapC family toxin n=1 Tax=Acinetobacter corruptisaponis TaxID=3045147 RepID=A0ABY8S4E6_9GAMM|nr:type II toxin-antitoxin system VapC family toxin [Acinetobacter sp. KCTC 92772]WHP06271.1 type II toxin-antitoxin system VapC family toxin [Acinetobacter sp. KCTC 92772]